MRRLLVLAASLGAAALLSGAAPGALETKSVATSSGSDPAIVDRVGQIDGTIYVGFAGRYGGVDWAVSTDGFWFTWEPDDAVTDPDVRYPGIPEASVEGWAPLQPNVGYRTVPGRIGVEKTTDGGLTWEPEWSLTDEQIAEIVNDNGPGSPSPSLYSYDLEVIPRGDDYLVVVANGSDGFAVRATTGLWYRASTHPTLRDDGTLETRTELTPPPVPIEWTAARNSPLPWSGVAWLVAVAALALPLRRRFRRAGLWAALPLAAIGGGILAWLWASTFESDPTLTWEPGRIGLLGVLALAAQVVLFTLALVALLGAALATLSLRARHWVFVIGWAALVGLGTLIAGNVAFDRLESVGGGAAVAAGAAAVLIGAGVVLSARMRARVTRGAGAASAALA